MFKDGWALHSSDSGASWCGFQYYGGCNSNLSDRMRDLQFYFTVELCGDAKCNSKIGENCSNCPTDCGACCGNGTCEAGETASCPQDCQECVDTPKLMNQHIPQWKRGEISMLTLMEKMQLWKAGTNCPQT